MVLHHIFSHEKVSIHSHKFSPEIQHTYVALCPHLSTKTLLHWFLTTNFTHATTYSIKTHQCDMNFNLKSPYPILEFEQITSFKILAYLHLNFNREHTHMQPQTYLCQAVRIFYYLSQNQTPNSYTCSHRNLSFLSLHFHHKFLAI